MVSKKNLITDQDGVPVRFGEDDLLTTGELAQALRCSRWTIKKWEGVEGGYQFKYGSRTTVRHCRAWLEKNSERLKRKPRTESLNEQARQEAVLSRMRQ